MLSATITGRGRGWDGTIRTRAVDYVLDRAQGATMLNVPVGHTLSAVDMVLGGLSDITAILANRRKTAVVTDTGETLPMTAWDQVIIGGVLPGGAPLSLHYRGGNARDDLGLLWEINGTEGDLRLTASNGHAQQAAFTLSGARGKGEDFAPIPLPAADEWTEGPVLGNVCRTYGLMSDDIRKGTRTASDFCDAVRVHQIIDAVERASESRQRTRNPRAEPT